MLANVPLMADSAECLAEARARAQRWKLPCTEGPSFGYQLVLTAQHLELRPPPDTGAGPVMVDWVGGASGHRRRFGGGRGQPIARAIGLKGGANPSVCDATAGLGRDAFLLASLGCRVTLVERSAIVAALLEDGLERARADAEIGGWVKERMDLVHADATDYLQGLPPDRRPDVVYLDPMYPERRRARLPKKEMKVLRTLLGADRDSDGLLHVALSCAAQRVVVKRPLAADSLGERTPTTTLRTRKHRFDVYVIRALRP